MSDFDGSTVYGGPSGSLANAKLGPKALANLQYPPAGDEVIGSVKDLPFVDAEEYLSKKHPFCVKIGEEGLIKALHELDGELRNEGHPSILSRKLPVNWSGREVQPGQVGMYTHGAAPKLLLKSGRYPGFPWALWWARTWVGVFNLSDTQLVQHGLTIVQVSQNQAAVCQDPQNQVFIVKNGGFAAVASRGAYKILDIVDQTHLNKVHVDKHTKTILGYQQDVLMDGKYVAATFLDIPANNIAILQRGNKLFELAAGQHAITHASVKVRGVFTKGEVQQELICDDIYTRDQVPVWLRLYLRWELQQPMQLTKHGYETPFDALQDKSRSILTQILAHLDYSSMAKQRNLTPEFGDPNDDVTTAFVDAVRTQATDDLRVVATEYGILLKDLAIVDRKFKGEIARKMDSLTTRALEAQVESSNLERENQNRKKKQEGDLAVAELQNQQRKALADTAAFTAIAEAKARAEALRIESEAAAQATRIAAQAEADAVKIKSQADADVTDEFARSQARSRMEVARTAAFGNKTVFVSPDVGSGLVGGGLVSGMAVGMGMNAQK